MSPALQRKSYDVFINPIDRTDYMSFDYYRGLMFLCNGFKIYRVNPTTNKVMGVTDIEVSNPILDLDSETQNNVLAICLNEKRVKRIDTYTGKVITEIILDRFTEGEMVPFKLHSAMTKAPDGIYFIDGYFNTTTKTNRIIKYDPISRTSTIVTEVAAANYNDLEFDDIGLLRLTDTKGVIERYNIIPGSPDYGKQIDEIPVGDPFPLREEVINPPNNGLESTEIAPPDITYFLEQPFAALTLEPNWEFKDCLNPNEWQLAINPCITPFEQNINFIKDLSYSLPVPLEFVQNFIVNEDNIVITLDPSNNYENVAIRLTDNQGNVLGTITSSSNNVYTYTLSNILGDRSPVPPTFEVNHPYNLEIVVILDTDIETQTYHPFDFSFKITAFPTTFSSPFNNPIIPASISTIDLSSQNPEVFSEYIIPTVPISGNFEFILDAMEDKQQDYYDKQQEILFLQQEKENLLRTKDLLTSLDNLKIQRHDLLQDHDTSLFPYNFQLAHIDQVILEYTTMLGSDTLTSINLSISQVDFRINYLKAYILELEEILRAAEFPCRTPRLFAFQYNTNASEEYEVEIANQTEFNLTNASYTIGGNDLLVYVNGTLQIVSIDYLETTTTSVTFNIGLNIGDIVSFVFYPTLDFENIAIPAVGGPVLVVDPIINRVVFPDYLDVAVGVQSPINLSSFKVYDAFDREISLYDLDPFYFELPQNNIVELRVNDSDYYLFGLQDGESELILHLANTTFIIPLNVATGITPSVFIPYNCSPKPKPEDYLWHLVFEDLTLCVEPEIPINNQQIPDTHMIIQGVTDTGHRQVNPNEWALIFEGTLILPDTYSESLIAEYAQADQPTEINENGFSLVLYPETIIEMPIVLENSLLTDIFIESENHLKLSPTAFERDLVIQEALEFDPALPEHNPLVLQQGLNGSAGPGGPLQIQFICEDVPADDSENTILLQGNSGGRHPVKITWDGDYCYVLYEGECSAQLIDLKSVFRKVFISSPDPEIYGLGLHSTNIFAQARDIEGQEFALSTIKSKAISFVNALSEFLQDKSNTTDLVSKIHITTDGTIYGPDTLILDESVIFDYHNGSGITLAPGKSILINFNSFKLLEGLTFLARTPIPLQNIVIETSNDGINFLESDISSISKTALTVYELNQFSSGIESNKITTNLRFRAPSSNTSSVDICLINLFYENDRFQRDSLPLQQTSANNVSGLIVANQTNNQSVGFVYSPDPLNFLSQTVAAPINPLISNPLKNVLESSSLVVTGLPASGILPAIFSSGSEFTAVAPISPITDIRGNTELIYRAGLMNEFQNKVLNSDWHWGMLNWDIVNNPIIEFNALSSSDYNNQITISRSVSFQERTSGIISKTFEALPDTDYYITFEGIDLTKAGLGFIKLDYYDVRGDFINSSAPISIGDTLDIISVKKTTPDYTHNIKVSVLIEGRNLINNPTSITDIIKMNWLAVTTNSISSFTKYEDNLDVIKIMIET